jgi:hypothetical protein
MCPTPEVVLVHQVLAFLLLRGQLLAIQLPVDVRTHRLITLVLLLLHDLEVIEPRAPLIQPGIIEIVLGSLQQASAVVQYLHGGTVMRLQQVRTMLRLAVAAGQAWLLSDVQLAARAVAQSVTESLL